jgi:hypothetical protein
VLLGFSFINLSTTHSGKSKKKYYTHIQFTSKDEDIFEERKKFGFFQFFLNSLFSEEKTGRALHNHSLTLQV